MTKRLILVEFPASTKNEASTFEVVDSEKVNGVKEIGKKVECRSDVSNSTNQLEEQFHYGVFRGEFTSLRLAKAEMNRLKEKEELKSDCPVLVPEGKETAIDKADVKSSEFLLVKTENLEEDQSAPDLLLPEASTSSELHDNHLDTEGTTEEEDGEDAQSLDYNGLENGMAALEESEERPAPFHLSIINTRLLPSVNNAKKDGSIEHLLQEMRDVKNTLLELLDNQAEILKRLSTTTQHPSPANLKRTSAPKTSQVSTSPNLAAQHFESSEASSRTRPARLRAMPPQNNSLSPSFYNGMPVLKPTGKEKIF
uniref:Uncharacterized protein n=1 Tax=Ditylenchus dipsaci TaxID=166011 RepID=A0A915DUD1_9BILA